ncbi:patatin-like phospholipase family protein [Limoniibacter endophyticus]|uniref:Patatin n=1 Tax=Limoniibacter endophyticus TaxID=1565040 RepID=A0A8J3DML9_9HYPH|nr:patatin-like phospholipase family protein [Limoniibacter endophyticus]GHC67890.1 patatin [Limoniibacter endophyticus]
MTPDAALSSKPQTSGPRFALALGGGGARGLAHVHAIDTLNELGIKPVGLAGSSIGSIMAAGMASGMTGQDIAAYARGVLSKKGEVASRMWKARTSGFGLRFTQFNIERIVDAFLPDAIPTRFEDLQIPLKVTAIDFYGNRLVVMEDGDLRSAIAASSAIPAVFSPVRRNGRVLIDGGFYNPVPFDLLQEDADIVIAVDVVGSPVPPEDPKAARKLPNSIELMFGTSQLMMQSIISTKLERNPPQVLIRPPVSQYRVLDFLKADLILEETASLKDNLKREIEKAVKLYEARDASV